MLNLKFQLKRTLSFSIVTSPDIMLIKCKEVGWETRLACKMLFKVFTEVCTEVEGRGVDEMKNVISNKLKWFIVRSEVGIL